MKPHEELLSGDQELVDQIIADFLRADAVGQAGDPRQWLDRYPSCAAALAEFFDDRAQFEQLVIHDRSQLPTSEIQPQTNGDNRASRFSAKIDTVDFAPEPPRMSGTQYRPLRFHARGGMGEIWLARDERIGRHVAVKKLRSGRSEQQPRFMVEAQITGQLEHPSIVPLHDLGLDDAGQPYYVMKFIHGRRLSEVIAEYHNEKSPVDWPNDLEFRKLLEIFVHVCNVVAYAHDKKVLHRDIKPDNVMLGPYGETLVVDWGLAKVIGKPDEEHESGVHLSGSGSTATQDGAVVGSPYYMSPEGAEGRPEAVDQSSDVYLLGATLYQIITAKPPRQGSTNWELIDLAIHSRPTEPRKLDSRIPRALEAVCLKAMAYRKQDRYPSPLALAEDVRRFLGGQPTSAYREPLSARISRRLRRHRRAIYRTAVALGVMTLASFAIYNYRQARSFAEQDQARVQLDEFHRLADEAQFFSANSDAVSERVPYYDPSHAKAAAAAALGIAAPWGDKAWQLPLPKSRAEFLQTKAALLLLVVQMELRAGAEKNAPRRALALLEKAGLIQPASRGSHQLRALCYARLGDAGAATRADAQAHDASTPVTAQDYFLAGELFRAEDADSSAAMLGDVESLPSRDHLKRAIDEYQEALQLDPRHYWARFQLGRCLFALGRSPEAVETLSACIALRPMSPWAYSARGLANALSGNMNVALADLNEAVRLDPKFTPARLNRGIVHWLSDHSDAAKADFNAVLSAPVDQRLVEAAFYRGQVMMKERQDQQATADFSLVIHGIPKFRPAYWLRAQAQFRLGNNEAGVSDVKKFLDLVVPAPVSESHSENCLAFGKALRKMAQSFEGQTRRQLLNRSAEQLEMAIESGPPTAEMYQQLGAVRDLLQKPQQAIAAYSRGLALSANDMRLLNMRGWAYAAETKYNLARADFAKALEVAPENSESHAGLGFVLVQMGNDNDARQEASATLLTGSNNFLALHNAACIYGCLSVAEPERRAENENLALTALSRATNLARQTPLGPDADEVALIRQEKVAFPDSLRSRPEFKRLLEVDSITGRN